MTYKRLSLMGCTLVRFVFLSKFFAAAVVVVSSSALAQSRIVAGEYIVKMKEKTGSTSNARLSTGLKMVNKMGSGISVKQAFWGSTMLHIKAQSAATIDSLRANPDVEYVEPNFILSVDPVDVQPFGVAPGPSDSYSQSYSNVQVTESWSVEKPYNQGTKTVVAVIDTGLDRNHGLFKDSNAIWENLAEKNGLPGIDDDNNGYIDDINGWNYVNGTGNVTDDDDHGTHVAGIILGVGQDILQYPVRESKVKIMALKFLDAAGSGTTANAINAMYYAVNMGAKVINNSWGGPSYSRSLHDAYTYAHNHGVMIASAAGNSGTNNDSSPMYPAALDTPNNLAVAASTDSDTKASFSNYGSGVQVAAPGVAIVSAVPGTGCVAPGCYQMMSGTSMASPFVAGLAALVSREAPQLSGYQIRSIVMASVNTFAAFSGKVSTSGRVNALRAIQNSVSQVSTASYNPAYTPVYKMDRSVAAEQPGAKAGGCGLVKAGALAGGGSNFSENGPPSGGLGNLGVIFVMILIPAVVAATLRRKTSVPVAVTDQRRQFARYNVAKDLVVKINDQIVSCATDTLSLGGLSFSSAFAIDKGSKVKVKIADLDQEVEGEVVWCSQKQSYGVKFINITEQLKANFSMWTVGLQPT